MRGLLSENVIVDRVMTAQAAGATLINTDGVLLGPGDSVLFAISWGTLTVAPTVHLEQSTDDAAYSDIEASEIATIDAADDDKVTLLDVRRPGRVGSDEDEYVRVAIDRTGGNAVVDSVVAYIYDTKEQPVTQSADVAGHKQLNAPVEGTK